MVDPVPGNYPPKESPIRKFYSLEYTEFLDYDEDDAAKFRDRVGYCDVNLADYFESFGRDLAVLKQFYIDYNGYTNRDLYKPLLLRLYSMVDFDILRLYKL